MGMNTCNIINTFVFIPRWNLENKNQITKKGFNHLFSIISFQHPINRLEYTDIEIVSHDEQGITLYQLGNQV